MFFTLTSHVGVTLFLLEVVRISRKLNNGLPLTSESVILKGQMIYDRGFRFSILLKDQ